MAGSTKVDRVADLMQALQSGVEEIEVRGTLSGMPMVTLPPGVCLRGGTVQVSTLQTGEIHSDGGIAPGTLI